MQVPCRAFVHFSTRNTVAGIPRHTRASKRTHTIGTDPGSIAGDTVVEGQTAFVIIAASNTVARKPKVAGASERAECIRAGRRTSRAIVGI